MDCIIAILLDKNNQAIWDRAANIFMDFGFDLIFFEKGIRKNKVLATLLYCAEVNPEFAGILGCSAYYLSRPSDYFNSMEDFYIAYPDDRRDWTRTIPEVVNEINKLRKIY